MKVGVIMSTWEAFVFSVGIAVFCTYLVYLLDSTKKMKK